MGNILNDGESLLPGQKLTSTDGRFHFYVNKTRYATLFKVRAGDDPVALKRLYCVPEGINATPYITISNGFLRGGYDAPFGRQPMWAMPRNGGGPPVHGPSLESETNGNVTLFNSTRGIEWLTNTSGTHGDAINPDKETVKLGNGRISDRPNIILVNDTGETVNVSDGDRAEIVLPDQSIGVNSPDGPNSLQVNFALYVCNFEAESADAGPKPPLSATVQGSTVRIARGDYAPLNWSEKQHHNFSHLKLGIHPGIHKDDNSA